MNENSANLEDIIRDYLLDEGLLRKKVKNPKLEFGFQFTFPPVVDPSKQRSQSMVVFQPKTKDLLIVSIGTQISPSHIEALKKSQDKKMRLFLNLKKFFHLQHVFFKLDVKRFRYEISDQIFLDGEYISKNDFFDLIRRIFDIQAYSNLMVNDFCSEDINLEDLGENEKFDSGSGFSLYS